MAKGKVKFFKQQKGYGFIEMDTGEEIFVHYKQIQGDDFKSLEPGQEVEFEIRQGEKGKYAINVVRL
jgi:CspA family cold shock protein